MSSVKPKQVNNTKKRKVSVGANDQQQNVKRVKIEQPNPPQKIQKKPKTAEATQNSEETKETRRKIVSKFFEQYYKELITDDEEWDLFCEVLSRKLPITFRINGPPAEKAELFKHASDKKIFKAIKDIKVDGKALPPPTTIPWYPNGLAYRFNINPSLLQTNNALKEMNDWLFGADMSGSINRQEEVSMIPPLLLDVNSSHKVLDLCSAPGSKTSQILGIMRNDASTVIETATKKGKTDDKAATAQKEESRSSVKSKYIKGMIVANDSNFKRCSVMSSMHDAALMITNHRGESFPSQVGSFKVEFDRVLCDVPCSGDGTMRKLPAKALAQWSSVDGLLLHRKQVEICQKGVDLLKPEGRIVYSTCSMNPVENEAVVTEILRKNKDLELVDVKNELPGLLRRPGLSSWKIMSKQGKFYSSYAEYENDEDKEGEEKEIENEDKMDEGDDDDEEHEEKKPDRRRKPIILLPSMFPPKSEAEASNYHLERCLRIYPHLQDTGGFFVAVFKKKKATSKTPTKAAAKTSNAEKEEDESNKKKLPNKEKRFPSELVAVPQDQYLALKKVFEISDDFPQNQLRVCKEELSSSQIRKIYFFSDAILPFVDALGTGASKDLTVVNAGLIIFERTTKDFHVKHNFSLTVDSLQVIKQYMGSKRLLGLPNKDFSTLVSQRRLFYADLTNNQNADSLKSLFTGYVIVTTRIKFGRQQQAQLSVLCRNGQGALTLCGNKWDLWPISFLGTTTTPTEKSK